MKIIWEHPCFPLYEDSENGGGICSVYMWCSPWSLKLVLLKTNFSKQIPDQNFPARLEYHPGKGQLSCSSLSFISWVALSRSMHKSHPIISVLHEDWNFRIRISRTATMALEHTQYQSIVRQSYCTAFYQHNTTGIGKAQIRWEALGIRSITKSVAFLKHLNGGYVRY